MKLLVDIGNSRLKWALAEGEHLTLAEPLPHHSATLKSNLLKLWWLLPQAPTQLVVSCVSKAELSAQVTACARELWPTIDIVIVKAQASQLGLHNAYAQPEKLGVDRWLAMLAVRHIYPQAACVVDCGTAITVDFINAQGQHLGGIISPGLALMKQALASGTEQLPLAGNPASLKLAQDTVAAIESGTLYAATGLIEKIVCTQNERFKLFITGGDAAAVAAALNVESVVCEDLVLRGLLLY